MSSVNMQMLGWGIVGTPKGRQQVDQGINQQLNMSFDLPQDFGVCLPAPSRTNTTPLYCLSRKWVENQYQVIGLAEYFPIFERGQTRAGSYFGAFVNVVNALFSTENANNLFSALRKLSLYQAEHFIDFDTGAYKQVIEGETFDSPMDKLNTVADSLQKLPADLLQADSKGKVLFVHCPEGEVVNVFIALLNTQLYYRYTQIFFSENEHIRQQILNKKIEQIDLATLASGQFWIEPYYKQNQLQQAELSKITAEFNQLKQNQSQLLNDKLQAQEAIYLQQTQQIQHQLATVQQELKNAQAILGAKLVAELSSRGVDLSRVDLAQFMLQLPEGNIASEFADIKNRLVQLQHQNARAEAPVVEEIHIESKTAKVFAWGFAVLSLLLFMLSIWLLFTRTSNDEVEQIQKEKAQVTTNFQQQLDGKEREIRALKSQLKEIAVAPTENMEPVKKGKK